MRKDLERYLYRTRFITPTKADEVRNVLDTETTWKDFDYHGPENICVQDNPTIPYHVTELNVEHQMTKYLETQIDRVVDEYIHNYLQDITWFNYWNGKTRFYWIRYPTGSDGMGTHADHVRNIFDGTRRGIPTLTVLGSLSDEYEGGDIVFWQDTPKRLEKGEVFIFPSVFLYPHEVTPITKGTRYSFAVWIW